MLYMTLADLVLEPGHLRRAFDRIYRAQRCADNAAIDRWVAPRKAGAPPTTSRHLYAVRDTWLPPDPPDAEP